MPIPTLPTEEEIDNKSGTKLPNGLLMYIIMVAIALVASFGINYYVGVSKAGITKFQTDTTAKVDSLSSDIRASTSSIKLALDSIPTTVDTKVTTALSSITSRMNTLESDIKIAKDNAVTATNNSANAVTQVGLVNKSITDVTNQIALLKTDISDLETAVGNNTALTALTTRITALETQLSTARSDISTLQNQYSLTTIVINTGALNYNIVSGVAMSVPVSITNSGTTNINVPMKLVLTTGGAVVVSTAIMDRPYTVTISGTTITYNVVIFVGANSTVSLNQSATVSYTGTSPNTWSAVWSKQ